MAWRAAAPNDVTGWPRAARIIGGVSIYVALSWICWRFMLTAASRFWG